MQYVDFRTGKIHPINPEMEEMIEKIRQTMNPHFMYIIGSHPIVTLQNGHVTMKVPSVSQEYNEVLEPGADDTPTWDPAEYEKDPTKNGAFKNIIGGIKYIWAIMQEGQVGPFGTIPCYYAVTHVRPSDHLVHVQFISGERAGDEFLGFFVKMAPNTFTLMEINMPIEGNICDEPTLRPVLSFTTTQGFGSDPYIGTVLDKRYIARLSGYSNCSPENHFLRFKGIYLDTLETIDTDPDDRVITYTGINM